MHFMVLSSRDRLHSGNSQHFGFSLYPRVTRGVKKSSVEEVEGPVISVWSGG